MNHALNGAEMNAIYFEVMRYRYFYLLASPNHSDWKIALGFFLFIGTHLKQIGFVSPTRWQSKNDSLSPRTHHMRLASMNSVLYNSAELYFTRVRALNFYRIRTKK